MLTLDLDESKISSRDIICRVSSIDKRLPYELRALEAGLSCCLRLLDGEVASLEKATLPRLDRLLGKVWAAT